MRAAPPAGRASSRGPLATWVAPLVAALFATLVVACGERSPDGPGSPSVPPAALALSEAQRTEAARLGMPASFENDLGMRFVLVPHGAFVMGDETVARDAPSEEPPHEVEIFGSYYLQAAEVTVAQWAAWKGEQLAGGAEPVTGVSHDDARAFAAWLTERDPRWVYRLPTEGEWDRAHHASSEHGEAGASGVWGFTGMDDAPWEWCGDWYAPLPSWKTTNPLGPNEGTHRVQRGAPGHGATRTGRRHAPPDARAADTGLRLAAQLSYGKADLGACEVTFRTVDADEPDPAKAEHPGYTIRVVAVIDRLMARAQARELPWVTLPGLSSPIRLRLPPGRFYAIAIRFEGGEEIRGLEKKFELDDGPYEVRIPIPKPGAMLRKPQ